MAQHIGQVHRLQADTGHGRYQVGLPERDVLGQADQQQEEDRQRQAHHQVLQRVDAQRLDQLEQDEADEGEQHEQHAVFRGTVGLGVGIDRIDQRHRHRLRFDRTIIAQLALGIGGQRGHRPACIEALRINAAFVGQERAAERRMRPARTQRDVGVIAQRHHRQHAAAIQAQLQFNRAGSQRAALIRSEAGHRCMQAAPHLAGSANARQQPQLLAIHAQVRRTDQATHIGYTNRDIRLAVTAAGLHRIVVCGEGRLHLAVPAVHRYLEQAHFALARQHLAAHLQRRRHLQPVPLGDLHLGLLDAQRVDQFNLLAFHPWHHPHRAHQLLCTGAAVGHPRERLVAVCAAFVDDPADHGQRHQQQQDQPADNGEPQQHLQGFHGPSSLERAAGWTAGVSRVCGEFEASVKSAA